MIRVSALKALECGCGKRECKWCGAILKLMDAVDDFIPIPPRPKDKPFFVMCHHKAPHREWIPDEKHRLQFAGRQIPEPPTLWDDYAGRTDALREHTSLRVTADYPMGQHYARTLAEWRSRFAGAAGRVSQLGFGPTFQRMWNLYLAYSEGGFRSGYLDVHQLVLERSW